MRMLKYKVFSYPYLADFTDDYIDSFFTIDVDRKKQGNKLKLSITYSLTDDTLLNMVDRGQIFVAAKITSPTVATSKAYRFELGQRTLSVGLGPLEFEKEVCIVCYLVADGDFYIENQNLSPLWQGIRSFVQKGNLIGETEEAVVKINRHQDGEADSIFNFTIGKNLDAGSLFAMDLKNDHILFILSKEDFDTFNRIQYKASDAIVSGVLLPCLVQIFSNMKEPDAANEGIDTTNDFNRDNQKWMWYQVLVDHFKRLYPEDDPKHTGIEPFKIAQEILKSPLSKMFTFSDQALKKGTVVSDE